MHLRDVVGYLDATLEITRFKDYAPNGLQVEGAPEVSTVITGVSANADLLSRAIEADADLIVVHHGLIWGGGLAQIAGPVARRLGLLLGNNVSLAAYHLPLDKHPHLGNNAGLADAIGLGLELADEREELALRGRGERGADLVGGLLDRVRERHQALLGREAAERDEQGGFARGEVHRRQLVRLVERVATPAAAVGADRHARVLEGLEVPVDGAQGDAEPLRELGGGHAGTAGAEGLGEGEQAGLAAHRMI